MPASIYFVHIIKLDSSVIVKKITGIAMEKLSYKLSLKKINKILKKLRVLITNIYEKK